jgi:molybdopterin converting factor subunit 1
MRITVRLFARLRDLAGAGSLALDVPAGATVEAVWAAFTSASPAAAPFRPSVSAAVNAEYARFTTRVAEGDEVAFLPPVSGG